MLLRPSLLAAKPAGGGGGYVAKAVHWDGLSNLHTDALTAADGSFFSCSFWFNSTPSLGANYTFFQVDPNGQRGPIAELGPNIADSTYTVAELALWDAARVNLLYSESGPTNNPANGNWHHFLSSGFTDTTPPRPLKIYLDDVDVSNTSDLLGVDAFSMAWDGLPFYCFDDVNGDPFTGDIADFWVGPGVSLLTGGDIALVDRRKFISASGKPVNPSGFPSGAVLFSGDHTTFPVNQGTGGAFTLTGTLTDASTSPSD